MKYQKTLLFLSLFCGGTLFAQEEKVVKSEISEVTVYSQGAQITRLSKFTARPGVNTIVIEGVSPKSDPKSLQVNASGDFVIIDSKYNIKYPEPEPVSAEGLPLKIRRSIALLEDSINEINFEISDLNQEIALYNSSKNILANNGAIKGQGKVNDSIELLRNAMDYYTQKTLEINQRLNVLNRRKSRRSTLSQEMNQRLRELRNYQNNAQLKPKAKGPTHRITITMSSKSTMNGNLKVSYMVGQAGWVPLYDLRADINQEKVNLNYKAEVYQNTGIDWDNVRLNVSTNNPYQNKTIPNIRPWQIHAYVPTPPVQQMPKRNVATLSSVEVNSNRRRSKQNLEEAEVVSDSYSYDATADMDIAYTAANANSYTTIVNHAISAEFKIDLPYTIKSNNERHMVLIKNVDLSADYKYYSLPKLDPNVYLVAELTELTEHQLVSAKANIFFDGSYVGETYLNPSQMSDTMTLSLGRDPNIIIKRTLMREKTKERTIGSSRERDFAFNYEVRSLKSSTIELVIKDQIPVSTNPEIEIEATELSKGDLDKKTGFIEWKFKLKAKESKEFDMRYRIEHDKSLNVNL